MDHHVKAFFRHFFVAIKAIKVHSFISAKQQLGIEGLIITEREKAVYHEIGQP